MDEANRVPHSIDNVNGATIGDVNAKTNAALIRDQPIAAVETLIPADRLIDNRDAISMHLLGGDEGHTTDTDCVANFGMNAVEPPQRFRFVMRHIETGDTQSEAVRD